MRTYDEMFAEIWNSWDQKQRDEFAGAAEEAELSLDLAEAVYRARTDAGMTQAQLAKAMGVSQSQISALEGGGVVPTVRTLAKIAQATNQRFQCAFVPAS